MQVINLKGQKLVEAVYIGRKGYGKEGSVLANQYRIGKDGSREEVIQKYRKWLWEKIQMRDAKVLSEMKEIYSKNATLSCFCKPLACHGDIIIRAIEYCVKEGII